MPKTARHDLMPLIPTEPAASSPRRRSNAWQSIDSYIPRLRSDPCTSLPPTPPPGRIEYGRASSADGTNGHGLTSRHKTLVDGRKTAAASCPSVIEATGRVQPQETPNTD
nr:hypothetical protein GCM10020063_088380 [Dactylosporangium thailandense]